MYKEIYHALASASFASIVGAIITGLFLKLSSNKANALQLLNIRQAEQAQVAKEAKELREELRLEKKDIRDQLEKKTKDCEELEEKYDKDKDYWKSKESNYVDALEYWINAALSSKEFSDYLNSPNFPELINIYEHAKIHRVVSGDEHGTKHRRSTPRE